MARSLGETTITISVLDRLIDLEPGNRMENPPSRSQSVRLLKSAVRRDLEWLLNTRRICDPPDEGLKEVNRSAYVYGLPGSLRIDHGHLRRPQPAGPPDTGGHQSIRAPADQRSPAWVETPDAAKNEVRLRIEAMLRMDPSPEPISFDTVIELKSGNCHLSGGDDAR